VDITNLTTYAEISDYLPNGKIGKIEYGNDTATAYTYDSQSIRLSSILAQKLDGTGHPVSDLLNRSYAYTAAGDISQIIDGRRSITYTYTYDALHRLTSESNTGTYDPISYTYDAIGNMLTRTVGSDTFTYTYDTAHKHAVKTINAFGGNYNYSYDANGNMTAGPDFTDPAQIGWRTISYNADNMPTQIEHVKGGSTVTTDIVYDGNSARAKKTVLGGNTTYYINENFEIIGSSPVKYVFAGNLRIAMIAASGVNYFHKDHLGSSNVITDNTGATVEITEYMPFGSIREHTGAETSNYKFTDQELDPESGLYNYNARLYDPVIGRFLSADTIVPYPFDPQILNRYSYVRNNPLIYIDPSGHFLGDLSGFGFDGIDGDDDGGDSVNNNNFSKDGGNDFTGNESYWDMGYISESGKHLHNSNYNDKETKYNNLSYFPEPWARQLIKKSIYEVNILRGEIKPNEDAMSKAECLARETKKDLTITSGYRERDKGAHGEYKAFDLGKRSNPGLTRGEMERAYEQCFDVNKSMAMEEENCYHFQTRPGLYEWSRGFRPGLRDKYGKPVK